MSKLLGILTGPFNIMDVSLDTYGQEDNPKLRLTQGSLAGRGPDHIELDKDQVVNLIEKAQAWLAAS